MSNIVSFFKNLSLSANDRLLKEMLLEEPTGTPTALGLELSALISYKANREEITKLAEVMRAEQEQAAKK